MSHKVGARAEIGAIAETQGGERRLGVSLFLDFREKVADQAALAQSAVAVKVRRAFGNDVMAGAYVTMLLTSDAERRWGACHETGGTEEHLVRDIVGAGDQKGALVGAQRGV